MTDLQATATLLILSVNHLCLVPPIITGSAMLTASSTAFTTANLPASSCVCRTVFLLGSNTRPDCVGFAFFLEGESHTALSIDTPFLGVTGLSFFLFISFSGLYVSLSLACPPLSSQ